MARYSRSYIFVFLWSLVGLVLAGCSQQAPRVVVQTVVVTAIAQANTPAAATATPVIVVTTAIPPTVTNGGVLPQPPQAPTLTSTPPAPALAPTNKPVPPSPTPPRLLVAGIPGEKDKIDGQIVYPDYGAGARTDLVFQVKARDPRKGNKDGAGIKSVDFAITDNSGNTVYTHTENNAAYCAFGGGDNGAPCNVFRFADNGFKWPGTNKPIQNGQYTLTVSVHPQSGDTWPDGTVNFQIKVK